MCTASWTYQQDGYYLLFNRDEKRTRKGASPPRLLTRDGVRFLAPADGDFGGTWIGVNEFGVSACLLNGANLTGTEIRAGSSRGGRSRGLLLLHLLKAPSAAALCE